MAHLSGDAGLLNAFSEDRDIHQATAAEVFGMPLEAVTSDQRRSAKMINFGLIYGMSAFGLAARLGIERGEAQKYVELYFERYPGVRRYMEETRQQARERGYVETVFGRRLYLNDISSRNAALAARRRARRDQCADARHGRRHHQARDDRSGSLAHDSRIDARLIMQVHDELVFEVQRERVDELIGRVRELMASAAELQRAAQGRRRCRRELGRSALITPCRRPLPHCRSAATSELFRVAFCAARFFSSSRRRSCVN